MSICCLILKLSSCVNSKKLKFSELSYHIPVDLCLLEYWHEGSSCLGCLSTLALCGDLRGWTTPKTCTHNHKPLQHHSNNWTLSWIIIIQMLIHHHNVTRIMWQLNKECGGEFTLDRVRFLGTSFKSSFKSVGSGMPKEKPPYLKENILQTKCIDFETCA